MRFLVITVKVALRALRRNAMRSFLTILGIIIGVAAVIAMVGIGRGASASVQEKIASLGNNMLVIMSGSITQGGIRMGLGALPTLTVNDAKAIWREAPAVAAVTYGKRQVAQVVAGNLNWSTAIEGVTPEFAVVRDWQTAAGRFFTKVDEDSAATMAVLGQTVVQNLFGPGENPLDQVIRIKSVPFRVVGVLTSKGQSPMGQDQDDTVLIPFTTAERKVLGTQMLGTVGVIMVSAVSPEAIPEAQNQIAALLRERHHLRRGQDDDFIIRMTSPTQLADMPSV